MVSPQEKLLLRLPEAAERLSIGRTSLYGMVKRGELPAVKVGSDMRIPMSALNNWIERQQENTHAE